jgi:Abnormal spindle-like microcephaly-assoc'd, ASPM-SPD-2-Hydin
MPRYRQMRTGARAQRLSVVLLAALALTTSLGGCGGTGKAVGEVTRVVDKRVLVGSTEAHTGDSLSAKSLLSTNGSGSVTFKLDSGTHCNTKRNSRLRIEPGGEIRISFLDGTSLCWKDPDAHDAKYRLPGFLISADDPVFAVSARHSQSIVHVTFGFVEVENNTTRKPVVVGPGQQAVVSSAKPSPRLEKSKLSPEDQKDADAAEKRIAKPEPSPPANLGDIAAGGELVVAVEPHAPASVEAFAKGFAKQLGDSWSVHSGVEPLPKDEAQRGLEQGDVDILVTPSQGAPTRARVPLFRRRGTTWVLALSPNRAFEHSLRDFIASSLQTGKYGALYLDTFGSQPRYTHAQGGFVGDLSSDALTPTALNFGQVDVGAHETHPVTLTAGSEDLRMGRVRIDSLEFTASNHCPAILTAGMSCTIDVAFAPASAVLRTATLTVARPSGRPLATTLSGTGFRSSKPTLAPAIVDFGQAEVGARTTRILTLTAGSDDLTIGDIGIGSAAFSATKDCPATLASEESCEIDVVFAPTASGTTSGTLSIDIGNDQSQRAHLKGVGVVLPTLKPSRLRFGQVAVGDSKQRVISLSAGSEPLTIIGLRMRNPKEFVATRLCSVPIAPETRCRITVEFKPLEAHRRRELLTISFSDRAPLRVQLIGTGIQRLVDLDPTSLDFGTVSSSAPSTKAVTLRNAGSAPLTHLAITSSDSQFVVDNSCPTSVAVGASCTFSITFTPNSGGRQSATVTVSANGLGKVKLLPLSGVGAED